MRKKKGKTRKKKMNVPDQAVKTLMISKNDKNEKMGT
jgi:hypothetical protein